MRVGVVFVMVVLLVCGASAPHAPAQAPRWLPVWQAVPTLSLQLPDQSVRTTIDLGAGGTSVRIRLSNLMGIKPVRVDQVTIVADGQERQLTFRGSRTVTIGARAEIYSDALRLNVTKALTISIETPAGVHCHARALGKIVTSTREHVCLLSAVEVAGFTAPGAAVMFGDSITEGSPEGTWPSMVESDYAILNAGIGGNGIVTGPSPMTTRIYRDVLYSDQVREVVLLGGINDIQAGTSADAVIAGIKTIQLRCQNEGVQLIVGTVTPWGGWFNWTEEREQQRRKTNDWIRATFPDAIDFDAAVRDPADPLRLRPEFDSGDHLHPNAAAFGAMARLVRV